MRRRQTRSFVVLAAAAALAGAIALPASPAGAAGGASMSVSPSTNLSDGDSVAVSVTGIPAGTSPSLGIWECHADASLTYAQATSGSCESLSEGNVSGGTLSTSVHVVYGRFTNGYDNRCDETTACELAAVDWSNGSTVLATAPISFKALSVGMTVTPDTGLKDGQKITVTIDASTVPASDKPLSLAECNTAYMAAHGGFGSGEGCYFSIAPGVAYYPFDPSKPATLNVVDGRTDTGDVACNYANNGDCAILLLGGNDYHTVATHPITFRAPIKGPATIAASPTTGLHSGVPGTVSMTSGHVADGFADVTLEECSPAAVGSYSGDWEYRACSPIAGIPVANNAFAPKSFEYNEGRVGNTPAGKPCDHAHPCEIGLVGWVDYGKNVLLSNWIPITFRAPNFGTPTLKLAKLRGLAGGDMVGLTATDVPDLVRALNIYECNVKGGYDSGRCHFVHSTPGDQGALIVHDNKTKGATKIRAGAVGYDSKTGKKVYCNAKTNGQCVLVAVTYPNSTYRIKSPVIRFAP